MTKRPRNHPKVTGVVQSQNVLRHQFNQAPVRLKKKKLLVIPPMHYDSTSWYRAAGPFMCIKDPQWDIEMARREGSGVDWTHLMNCDLAFLQRPYQPEAWEVAQVLYSLGKPIWIDYDDFLFGLPESNGAFFTYEAAETKDIMTKMIRIANVITVSTQQLRDELIKLFPQKAVIVIPNAWNDYVHKWEKKPYNRTKVFFWRGGVSHREDIAVHLDSIGQVANEYPDWEWFFLGDPNYLLNKVITKSKLTQATAMNTVKYFNFIKVLEAPVTIVPLANSVFNQCKSNIAWQETTMGGSAVVAPSWREWAEAGPMAHYGFGPDTVDFVGACINAVENGEKLYNESWQYIQDNLLLSKTNDIRLKIMNGIT